MVVQNKKVLVPFNGKESSFRAVDYVGGIARNCSGCEVILLYVEAAPDESLLGIENGMSNASYSLDKEQIGQKFEEAKLSLFQRGIPKEYVTAKIISAELAGDNNIEKFECDSSVASAILKYYKKNNVGTIVLSRGCKSISNDFGLGVVSSYILKLAVDCTVWIVG